MSVDYRGIGISLFSVSRLRYLCLPVVIVSVIIHSYQHQRCDTTSNKLGFKSCRVAYVCVQKATPYFHKHSEF